MKKIINTEKSVIKIWTNDIEGEAEQQLKNLANMPFIHKHVAVMPDVHSGKGSTVGTVIATRGAIIPSCIGVDIGCGMTAVKLPFKIDVIDHCLPKIRSAIESVIPVGFHGNKNITDSALKSWKKLLTDDVNSFVPDGVPWSLWNNPLVCSNSVDMQKALFQLGSLGGGNHFIEICYDEQQNTWIMLHSGSRNIGKTVADVHINTAKGLMRDYFINLADPDLAYLAQGTNEFDSYIHDMNWCQQYAYANRQEIMSRVLDIMMNYDPMKYCKAPRCNTLEIISCHHNYTTMENHFGKNVWVTRKGAVSARKDQLGIIPSSMGNKSFIVRGLGNPDSFHSCSHGAGRKMSRSKARSTFTVNDLIAQTAGVECRKDIDIIDEIPSSYKSIDEVMANQADLVSIEHILLPVICVKG